MTKGLGGKEVTPRGGAVLGAGRSQHSPQPPSKTGRVSARRRGAAPPPSLAGALRVSFLSHPFPSLRTLVRSLPGAPSTQKQPGPGACWLRF